jgi:PAS domain S-box-containing protein
MHERWITSASMNRPRTAPVRWLATKAVACAGFIFFLSGGRGASAEAISSTVLRTNVQYVAAFGLERARHEHPQVAVEGVVTFLTRRTDEMFIHDTNAGIVVRHTNELARRFAGQRVRVTGELQAGLLMPFINRALVEVLGTSPMPAPLHVPAAQLDAGDFRARWVQVSGAVRDVVQEEDFYILAIRSGGVRIPVFVMGARNKPLPVEWLDAPVTLQGVSWPEVDREGKHIGTWIHLASTETLHISARTETNMFALPRFALGTTPELRRQSDARRKISATVLYHSPANHLFVQDETGTAQAELFVPLVRSTAWATLVPRAPVQTLQPGDRIELVGAPSDAPFAPQLIDAEFRVLGKTSPPAPRNVNARAALSGKHDGELVTLRAKVLGHDSRVSGRLHEEVLLLDAAGTFFEAVLETSSTNRMALAPQDSLVDVTGLCTMLTAGTGPLRHFRLWLRDPAEVRVLGAVPWWASLQPGRILAVAGCLGALALAWIWLLRRRVDQRTAALAAANAQLQQSAAELRESETKFRTLFESGTTAVVIHDEHAVIDCNPACLRIFGYTRREDFLGKHPAELSPPRQPDGEDSMTAAQRHIGKALATGRHQFEWLSRRGDGTPVPVEVVLTPVQLNGRKVLQALIHDITKHKRTEEKAHRSEAVTRSINYFATSLLARDTEEDILWDLAKNCVAQLGFVDCVIYLLDRDLNILVQKAAHGPKNPEGQRILNPITVPLGQGIVGCVAASGRAEIVGDTRRDPRYILDDEPRLAELTVPIIANNEVLGVIDSEHPAEDFFTQDHLEILTSIASLCANKLVRVRAEQELRALNIELEQRVSERTGELATANTQLKQAEQELLKALAQEKELGELKGRFVSMVSHEFRTPLGIIMSSAEILEAYLDRLPLEERRENLRDISEATKQMSRMMEEVLLLGTVEAGRMTCRPAALDLTLLCLRLVDEIISATGNRCPIEVAIAPGLPEAIVDESLLRHIFSNLLNNAVKYSRAGSPVEFRVEARSHLAIFTVRDRGIGIPEADARSLFQAFHRGRNVGDTQGTGLGMTIVKRCVELHRGKIAFESQEGEGTTFIVALPLFGQVAEGSGETQRFIRDVSQGQNITLVP